MPIAQSWRVVSFDIRVALYNVRGNGTKDYLSVGEDMLPVVYMVRCPVLREEWDRNTSKSYYGLLSRPVQCHSKPGIDGMCDNRWPLLLGGLQITPLAGQHCFLTDQLCIRACGP